MYMLKHNYLKYLYISRMIRYKERYVFKEYIDTLYTIRLQAKAKGNKVQDQNSKILLNSLYGKFG